MMAQSSHSPAHSSSAILSVAIQYEHDVVAARQRARQITELLGFDTQTQTHIATAVSEVARNAFIYASGGMVEFLIEGKTAPQILLIRISDHGPGIAQLERILDGQYQSTTGMGVGLIGARRLMDQFYIESAPGQGTTVWLKKLLPRKAPLVTTQHLAQIAGELARQQPRTLLEEVQQQNQELLQALAEVRKRQEELVHLNRELEDTNRGVLALYAELDEKADHLRRANDLKTRFLSNMSHEFRTPVNSILSLSRLLLDRTDGELGAEQEKQVHFIRKAADGLSELVNDLLDLAKIEAGKVTVRPVEFAVDTLFSALRGMLRPLLLNDSITLVFDEPTNLPLLYTDEGKVSQILRNFLSNAVKFTEHGEVRVSAAPAPGGQAIIFSVADTGIGIALADQEVVFQEFTQLENPLQKRVKGTGLGLPLCKKLAALLGGTVSVRSEPGRGATFSVAIPLRYHSPSVTTDGVEVTWQPDPSQVSVLVVEDHTLLYEKFLRGAGFQVLPAPTLKTARLVLQRTRPKAIILDTLVVGEDAWAFLAELKRQETTEEIPVLVVTTRDDQQKAVAVGADAYGVKPLERGWLLEQLTVLTKQEPVKKALVIDDDEIARYLLKQILMETYVVTEAANGLEGLRRAREEYPSLIFVDLEMPDLSGFEIVNRLQADPLTSHIPIIVHTATLLGEEEHGQLVRKGVTVLSKNAFSRETVRDTIREALVTLSPERRMV